MAIRAKMGCATGQVQPGHQRQRSIRQPVLQEIEATERLKFGNIPLEDIEIVGIVERQAEATGSINLRLDADGRADEAIGEKFVQACHPFRIANRGFDSSEKRQAESLSSRTARGTLRVAGEVELLAGHEFK